MIIIQGLVSYKLYVALKQRITSRAGDIGGNGFLLINKFDRQDEKLAGIKPSTFLLTFRFRFQRKDLAVDVYVIKLSPSLSLSLLATSKFADTSNIREDKRENSKKFKIK